MKNPMFQIIKPSIIERDHNSVFDDSSEDIFQNPLNKSKIVSKLIIGEHGLQEK